MSREKDMRLEIRLSQKEKSRIEEKMAQVGVKNMSAFIRKMALDGYCVRLDLTDIREMVRLLGICSNNLNQYAKKANQTDSIYAADIADLREKMNDIYDVSKIVLEKVAMIK